jgi:sortase (surface protein transpeptidase)
VGWWAFGAAPGQEGNVVLAGHIDAYDRGIGTFASLTGVRVGEPVEVTDTGGDQHRYRVVGRRTYLKQALPRSIYRRTGPAKLVLVTCGGRFLAGHYDSNIVVYAVPG